LPGALGPGAQIGPNYKVTREIGRGGMGVVYEAVDISLRRPVAVKQLRADLREDPKELESFLAEARLVASLKHPNIVEIHSLVDQGGEVFLVFEFVPGNPLHRVLQRVPRLPLASALSVFRQVGAALDHAHAQRVIHRDLKPANIMVTPQGVAKVMDFGLAYQARLTVARQTRVEASGTPPYMAPEQETGTVSKESDLYALGVCVYESLAGTLPFPGPNFLVQKREMKLPLVSQLAPGVPQSVDVALRRALHPDPSARFHSAAELLAAISA
ncbi:MAG: protein kinase, partial [Elusimicrobia bacterium]